MRIHKSWSRQLFCWRWHSKAGCSFMLGSQSHRHNSLHKQQFSTLSHSFLTDLSLDIDLNGLKDEVVKQKRFGNKIGIYRLVDEALEQKCSDAIRQLSKEQARMLQIIQLEHGFLYAEGHDVIIPELITNKNWIEAMTYPSKEERLHHYLYLQHRINLKAHRDEMREATRDSQLDIDQIDDSFVLPVDMTSRLGNHRLSSAMTQGLPLVFDMGFDDAMNSKEFGHAAKQLWLAYVVNRGHPNPFHFVFTDCQRENILYRTLELRHLLSCQHFLVSETEKSYLDLYDQSKLVYLSSHAKHVLRRFDPSCVYIVGAYSDPHHRKRFGPAKAKEQGMDCVKLPIDEHIKWIQGTKDLTLPQVVKVLLSMRAGGEWRDAFADALTHGKNFKHYGE